MNKSFFIFFSLFSYSILSFSQEIGSSLLKNFVPKETKGTPQNWSIVQDKRGLMYFANSNQGILEYDGSEWRLLDSDMPPGTVRSLAIDSNGVIYAGGRGCFGVLNPSNRNKIKLEKKGELRFVALSDKLKPDDKNFADVFKTYATKEGVFFQSYQSLILWNNGKYKIWYPSKDKTFHLSFYVNENLYIREKGTGLFKLENGRLNLVKGGDAFADERIFTMLPMENNKILMGTDQRGTLIYNLTDESVNKDERVNKGDDFIIPNKFYHGVLINKSEVAFSTFNGGSIVFNTNGEILKIINSRNGLQNEVVQFAFPDNKNNLWMALGNGISRAELSPISLWNESNGLKGGVNTIVRYNNKIYSGTDYGVFFLENNLFHKVGGISSQCLSLLKIPSTEITKKEILLAGTVTGIYVIEGDKSTLISNYYTNTLSQSKKNPLRVFAGLSEGISSFLFKNGKWIDEGKITKTFKVKDDTKTINYSIKSIAEDKNGELWLGTDQNGVFRIRFLSDNNFQSIEFPFVTQYDTTQCSKLVGSSSFISVKIYNIKDLLIFATAAGVYYFDEIAQTFKSHSIFKAGKNIGTYVLSDDLNGNVYMCRYDLDKPWIERLIIKDNKIIKDSLSFKRLKDINIETIFTETNGIAWIGCNNGIFKFDSKMNEDLRKINSPLIRFIKAGKDTLFFGCFFNEEKKKDSLVKYVSLVQSSMMIPEIQYSHNQLKFNFSLPEYREEASNIFSYFLEGNDEGWSDWSGKKEKEYTNLSPGNFTFHLKAKNIYGIESSEVIYKFIILPPWYRTVWAYILYVILFIVIVYVIVKINTYRLIKEKENLEAIVKQRTAEVVQQKEEIEAQRDQLVDLNEELHQQKEEIITQRDEIEKQRDEISEQKKEMTDSIHYAKRIQTAILPPEEYVTKSFPEHFILFKPRDIVSGDFYWAKYFPPMVATKEGFVPAQEDDGANGLLMFCVADCTGHGVPGAFMSMLGTAFLNEIANSYTPESIKTSLKANEVLNQLRELIIKSLHQTGKMGEQKDGMDIVLCILDLNPIYFADSKEPQYALQYAGANNPLYVIRQEKFEISDGDKLDAIEEVDPDKMPIGIYLDVVKPFKNNTVYLNKGDMIFLTTDGYADQFGGPKGKKFMYKPMKRLFLEIFDKTTSEQKEMLNDTIENWKGEISQIDDISVMGMRI